MKKLILAFVAVMFTTVANAAVNVEKLNLKVAPSGLYVKQTQIPTVNMLFTFKAGTVYENGYQHGTANLVANLLMSGTQDKTAEQLQESLEKLASNISVYSSRDTINIEVISLQENIEPTLQILQEILTKSNFPEKEVEILKASVVQGIRQQHESPGYIAAATAKKEFYGEDNIKAYVSNLGTEKSIAQIEIPQLQSYFKEYLTKQNMRVSVVSSLDRQNIERLLNTYLVEMHEGKAKKLNPIVPQGKSNWARVEKKLPQTTVLLYTQGMQRADKDYYTSVVFNYILGGGGFSSRLMEEIREKRGLTYGVRSAFDYDLPYPSLFTVTLQTSTANASKTESLIRKELDSIGKGDITAQELANAKKFLVGSFPIRVRTSDKLLGYLEIMQSFNLPLDYLIEWSDNIDKVTLEDVNNFARQFSDDKYNFSRVFVGDM